MPTRKDPESAGYELYADLKGPVAIPRHGNALIPIGLAMVIPKGYYGRIAPCSDLAVKHQITVGAWVVESNYRDEIEVLLFNHGSNPAGFLVHPRDRIAQIIFEKITRPELKEVMGIPSE